MGSSAFRTMQVGDAQQALRQLASHVPTTQMLRELTFNGIQACERAGGGSVVVDQVTLDTSAGRVEKMRFWDTGDGMCQPDLVSRINQLAAADRTGSNFGVGLKVSLYRSSPAGAIYVSMRDGRAHLAKVTTDPVTGEWGMAVVAPHLEGEDRYAHPLTEAQAGDLLPAEILAAGHGTVVIVLGADTEDRPWITLQHEAGSGSRRWVAEYLYSRFTYLPEEVTLRVVSPWVNRASKTSSRNKGDSRPIPGSIGACHEQVRLAAAAGTETGAHGQRRLTRIPGEVRWWILPDRERNSTMGLGGKMRLSLPQSVGETYATSRSLPVAGITRGAKNVELHFLPDLDAVTVDMSRTGILVCGQSADMALQTMAQEFAKDLPGPLRQLVKDGAEAAISRDHAQRVMDLHAQRSRILIRAARGNEVGRASDNLVVTASTPRAATATARESTTTCAGEPRGSRRLRTGGGDATSQTGSCPGSDNAGAPRPASTPRPGDALAPQTATSADGHGRKVAAKQAPVAAPIETTWVNEPGGELDVSELSEAHAAQYLPEQRTLLLNASFLQLRKEEKYWIGRYASAPSIQIEARKAVRDAFAHHMLDVTSGALANHGLEFCTPAGLTMAGYALRPISADVGKTLGRMFKASQGLGSGDVDGSEASGSGSDDLLELAG